MIRCCFTLAVLFGLSLAAASQATRPPTPQAKPAQGALLYRNGKFGFRYQIRFGWVERTNEMREDAETKPSATEKSASAGEVLLAVFERPPDAPGESVNSAVVIASEDAAAYPGLKKAEDFLGPLTELTTTQGFKPDGDPSITSIEARELVRADFIKPLTEKVAMYQSTLILFSKGQIVTFTFVAGSEDEIDDLIDGLHFSPAKVSAR